MLEKGRKGGYEKIEMMRKEEARVKFVKCLG
jgi:hypothetical protein